MKRLITIGVFALAMTGCIQEKIDSVEKSCRQAADEARVACDEMIDEALDQFWEQLERELRTTLEDIDCERSGPGDLEYDCSNTFLCPDKGE